MWPYSLASGSPGTLSGRVSSVNEADTAEIPSPLAPRATSRPNSGSFRTVCLIYAPVCARLRRPLKTGIYTGTPLRSKSRLIASAKSVNRRRV